MLLKPFRATALHRRLNPSGLQLFRVRKSMKKLDRSLVSPLVKARQDTCNDTVYCMSCV